MCGLSKESFGFPLPFIEHRFGDVVNSVDIV